MNNTWKRVAVIIAVLIPVVVVGAMVMKQNRDTEQMPTAVGTPATTTTTPAAGTTTTPTPSAGTNTDTTTAATYTDGTYNAVGSYNTPEGMQSMAVALTVKDDVVTAVTVTPQATGAASKMWQEKFVSGIQAQVVGKKLASLHLTNVSGSSLTPAGFNEAVSDIQNQAKI